MTAPEYACTRCGACCAGFAVDFTREECDDEGGTVPAGLVVDVTASTCRMRGADHASPRCAALVGELGVRVRCAIHEWRPSPCREFGLRARLGISDDSCARARHDLPPL